MPPWNPAFLLSFFLFLACTLSGCSKERHSPPDPGLATSLLHLETMVSLADAQKTAATMTLHCGSGACPPGVGMLLAADSAGGFDASSASVATCTVFLVGDELALTNSHCIPSIVKLLPQLCPERVRIVLPASGSNFPEESFSCSELLGHSLRSNAISPDLALLRLERKTFRPALFLSTEGVPPRASLLTHKVTRLTGTNTGILRSEICTSVADSYRMPIYRTAADPMFVLGDCTALPGNSGAPVLNESGQVVGTMQAELPISAEARAEWGPFLEDGATFPKLALGTSLRCLMAPPPAWSWSESDCPEISEASVALARPRIRHFLDSSSLLQETTAVLAPYLSQSPVLRWQPATLESKALARKETLRPLCFSPPEEWTALFRQPGEPEGALLEEAELTLRIPIYRQELRFNRFLQAVGTRVRLLEAQLKRYRFHPQHLAREGVDRLELLDDENAEDPPLGTCGGLYF